MYNLLDYLKYKYAKLNNKLIKKQQKLKRLEQSGGTVTTTQINTEIFNLKRLIDILITKIQTGETLGLDEILATVTQLSNALDKKLSEIPDYNPETTNQHILNLLSVITNKTINDENNIVNIKLQSGLSFVQPPINTFEIGQIHLPILESLKENIRKFQAAYQAKDTEETSKHTEQTQILTQSISDLKEQTKQISDQKIPITTSKNTIDEEILTYELLAGILKNTYFFTTETLPQYTNEMINITKISGMTSGEIDSETSRNIANLNQIHEIDDGLINQIVHGHVNSQTPSTMRRNRSGRTNTPPPPLDFNNSFPPQQQQQQRQQQQRQQQQSDYLHANLFNSKYKTRKIMTEIINRWANKVETDNNKKIIKNSQTDNNKKIIKNSQTDKNNQIGGSWNAYHDKLIEYQQEALKYKQAYNEVIEAANDFNLAYMRFYYFKVFIVNYAKLVFLREDYSVYQNISRGTVSYYKSIVTDILSKITNSKTRNNNDFLNYFYTYHYYNLHIMDNFLNYLYTNWLTPNAAARGINNISEAEKNVSRMHITTHTYSSMNEKGIKKNLFLFNMFKDILDEYKHSFASPISVYLRINDKPSNTRNPNYDENFSKIDGGTDRLDINKLKSCISRLPIDGINDSLIEDNFGEKGHIKFNEIFDPAGFANNDTLALYMSLPSYLAKQKSIMLITYGYSGVGKTFTLFGKPGVQNGILQKTLTSIQGSEGVYSRTYEIYGKALPYKSYWSGRTPDQYNHQIYIYKIDSSNPSNVLHNNTKEYVKTGQKIKQYLDDVKESNMDDTNSTYVKIESNEITNFSIFVDAIDNIRKTAGRIKKTVNNPESSRSIMVYDFKIQLSNGTVTRFTVMDLPGKEDIITAYVAPPVSTSTQSVSNTSTLSQNNFASASRSVSSSSQPTYSELCINIKDDIKNMYNERALRAAIYLNPMLLSVFPLVAYKLYEFMNRYNPSELWNYYIQNPVTSYKPTEQQLNESYTIGSLRNWARPRPPNNSTSYKGIQYKKKDENFDTQKHNTYKYCIVAAETLRFLLDNNRFDILSDFYKSELLALNDTCASKNFDAISFEGFYINENIMGLINTLNKRLYRTCTRRKNPIMSMENYFSQEMIRISNKFLSNGDSIYNVANDSGNETRSQTYFVRDFLREPTHFYSQKYLDFLDDTEANVNISNVNISSILLSNKFNSISPRLYEDITWNNKTLKAWFEDSYDFNKVYSDEPPIETFMEAYFGQDRNGNDIINNFYLFYVVSNDDKQKCSNQIKLISDSEIFIRTIREYIPGKC